MFFFHLTILSACPVSRQNRPFLILRCTEKKYTNNYHELLGIGKEEVQKKFKPTLKARVNNFNEYDTIFIGSPIWWYTISSPVLSFASEYNFEGKAIAPFVTHGGSGASNSFIDLKGNCNGATVLEGLSVNGSEAQNSKDEVRIWLDQIKLG